jgi:glycosyltransferase involved in cell wall biosynthesis
LAERSLPNKVSLIPVYAFDSFPDRPWSTLAQRSGLLFVAGFRHTPNVGAAIWFVREVLPLVQLAVPGAKVRLVGSNPPAEVQELAGPAVEVTGHVPDAELEQAYLTSRVALAPLLVGGGMKGKVIESMRFGTPCVATPVGGQGLAAADDFLAVAGNPRQFAEAVIRLLRDDEEWGRVSRKAQAFARDNFSMDAMWRVIGQDIDPRPHASKQARFGGSPRR